MARSSPGPDRPEAEAFDAAKFLGEQPNEVALFALAHRPQAYVPLTEAEINDLKAAVAGTLPASLSGSVRELLRRNAAAKEFVVSEQLLESANRKPPLPAHLSSRVLRRAQPAKETSLPQRWRIFSWRFAGLTTAVAGLALTVIVYGLNRSEPPDFTVAALDDYEILADSGTVTRGGGAEHESGKARLHLNFFEVRVEQSELFAFFDNTQQDKDGAEANVLAQLSTAAHQTRDRPHFVFDAAIAPVLATDKDEMITLRVYDLSDPANGALATLLHLSNFHDQYFVTLAP